MFRLHVQERSNSVAFWPCVDKVDLDGVVKIISAWSPSMLACLLGTCALGRLECLVELRAVPSEVRRGRSGLVLTDTKISTVTSYKESYIFGICFFPACKRIEN